MNLVIAITGASGAIYGIRLLEFLKPTEHHVSLIISPWGRRTIQLETDVTLAYVESLADTLYPHDDLAAPVASGSHLIDATVVLPCSMKTLSSLAQGFGDNLISRSGDVALKERRPLILVPRETPLHAIHLRNMATLCDAGAIILPPTPAFYHKPQSIDDIINQTIGKILDNLHIPHQLYQRWGQEI